MTHQKAHAEAKKQSYKFASVVYRRDYGTPRQPCIQYHHVNMPFFLAHRQGEDKVEIKAVYHLGRRIDI